MDPLSSSPFTFLAAMSWDITFNQDSLSSGIGAFHPQSIPLENLLPAHFLNTIITPVVPHPPGPISTTDFPLPVPISNAGSQGVQTLPPILTPSSLPRTAARKSLKANVRKRRRSVSTPAVRAPEEDNCCICLEFRGLFSVTTLYQNHRQSLAYGHLWERPTNPSLSARPSCQMPLGNSNQSLFGSAQHDPLSHVPV